MSGPGFKLVPIRQLDPKPPRVPYYSTIYGCRVLEGKVFGPAYWQLNMESPVLFRTAVCNMLEELGPGTAHLELGPHSALADPLRQIYEETGSPAPYASALIRGTGWSTTMLEALGKLFCFGIPPPNPGVRACNHVTGPAYLPLGPSGEVLVRDASHSGVAAPETSEP